LCLAAAHEHDARRKLASQERGAYRASAPSPLRTLVYTLKIKRQKSAAGFAANKKNDRKSAAAERKIASSYTSKI
jgi:hypothetical protein